MNRPIGSYWIRVGWGSREESIDACAIRAAAFLRELATVHPRFAAWFDRDYEKQALVPFAREPASLRAVMERRRTRTEAEIGRVENMGFAANLTNVVDGPDRMSLAWRCGHYGAGATNECKLELPTLDMPDHPTRDVGLLGRVLDAMAQQWNPEWGVIMTDWVLHPRQPPKAVPWIDWVTDLPVPVAAIPRLPAPARVEPCVLGARIILTDERFDAANEAHVEIALAVHAIASKAGLLTLGRAAIGS